MAKPVTQAHKVPAAGAAVAERPVVLALPVHQASLVNRAHKAQSDQPALKELTAHLDPKDLQVALAPLVSQALMELKVPTVSKALEVPPVCPAKPAETVEWDSADDLVCKVTAVPLAETVNRARPVARASPAVLVAQAFQVKTVPMVLQAVVLLVQLVRTALEALLASRVSPVRQVCQV